MAYGDRVDPTSRAISLVLTALLGTATVLGMWLAFNPEFAIKALEKMDVINVEEPPPPPEKEPPPPPPDVKITPPPVVIPPSPFQRPTENVLRDTTPKIPPQAPVIPQASKLPDPPKAVPPPPPPTVDKSKKASPQGNPGRWASTDDYPSRDLREENEGVTRFSVQIGPNGRVSSCSVSGSSGHPSLDAATCKLVSSRAKFAPALDKDGNPTTGSYSSSVRWVIPKE
jgi:periplasmic protein TonB